MGRPHLRTIESLLHRVLSHLLLVSLAPDSAAAAHWLTEVQAFHAELCKRASASLLHRINLEQL
jgi:hypothetical protein